MTKFLVMICLLTLTVGCNKQPSHSVTESELPAKGSSVADIAESLGNKVVISDVQKSFSVMGNQINELLQDGKLVAKLGGPVGQNLTDSMDVSLKTKINLFLLKLSKKGRLPLTPRKVKI